MTAEVNQPNDLGAAIAAEWGVTAEEYTAATYGVGDPAIPFAEVLEGSGYFTSGIARDALEELRTAADYLSNYAPSEERARLAAYVASLLHAMDLGPLFGKTQE